MTDSNGTLRTIATFPVSLWIVLATQTVAIVIWAVRLDSRVHSLEVGQAAQDKIIEHIDKTGSQALIRVEERQRGVIERLGFIQRQVDGIVQLLSPHRAPGVVPP